MPRLTQSVPKYRKHKASGQAIVTLAGRDYYLGPHNTKASKVEYDRLITEWLAGGRPTSPDSANRDLTITELLATYWRFAQGHYRKNGKGTSELDNIRNAVRPLKTLYGQTTVAEFGTLALKAIQQQFIRDGISRGVINSRIGKIKRVFRWAESEQLAPRGTTANLATVAGLQAGRTAARESDPVLPVSDEMVEATLPHLPATVADMVRFQRLTGCRPGEVCQLRPCDIDRTNANAWAFTPREHKTQHHGRQRTIFIGPRAQAILLPYLDRPAESYCFSPQDSESKRKAELRANRQTPVQPSQRDRSKPNAKRKPGEQYNANSYLYAIRRGCERAFPLPAGMKGESARAWRKANWWAPNQLRHTAGTEIRRQFGLEAAQVILGHSRADVTQIYSERDLSKAAEIARQIG